MLAWFNSQYSNFLLPQRDMLGFCDNYKSPGFLNNVQGESCLQKSTETEFFSLATYTN